VTVGAGAAAVRACGARPACDGGGRRGLRRSGRARPVTVGAGTVGGQDRRGLRRSGQAPRWWGPARRWTAGSGGRLSRAMARLASPVIVRRVGAQIFFIYVVKSWSQE
jgi:hypothetical protein